MTKADSEKGKHGHIKLILDREKPKPKNKGESYIRTGIKGLDDLFDKGIPRKSSVLIAGGAGSGKTLMCLQILANAAKQGKKCLYMSFEESEERLRNHMKNFGWDLGKNEKNMVIKKFNLFEIARSIDALLAKQSGELMIDVKPVILPENLNPDIIVLDSLTAIASSMVGKESTYRIYIEQLFRYFEKIGTNTFLISETEELPKIYSPTGVEEFLADGVIVLYNMRRGNIRESAIEVLKMRGAKHVKKIVAMRIMEKKGIEVYPNQEVFAGER